MTEVIVSGIRELRVTTDDLSFFVVDIRSLADRPLGFDMDAHATQ
jgi:hypothetical protein